MVVATFLAIPDFKASGDGVNITTIACLATGLAIERRFVQQDDAFIALVQLRHRLAIFQQGYHFALLFQLLITEEFGFAIE